MSAALEKIAAREAETREWLEKAAPDIDQEQKHLEEGSEARAYWHYGYLVALADVRRLLSQ